MGWHLTNHACVVSLLFPPVELNGFTGFADSVAAVLATRAREIDEAKKIAVGQRILVQNEAENRRREQMRLKYQLLEIRADIQRFVLLSTLRLMRWANASLQSEDFRMISLYSRLAAENASLQRTLQEQAVMKEKLAKIR